MITFADAALPAYVSVAVAVLAGDSVLLLHHLYWQPRRARRHP